MAVSVDCLQELEKLRVANQVAKHLLSGDDDTEKDYPGDEHAISQRHGFLSSTAENKFQQKWHSEKYNDIWGADEYLVKSGNIAYVKQHLANTEAILKKTGALLFRVSEQEAYETVEDSELLKKQVEDSVAEPRNTFLVSDFEDSEKVRPTTLKRHGTEGNDHLTSGEMPQLSDHCNQFFSPKPTSIGIIPDFIENASAAESQSHKNKTSSEDFSSEPVCKQEKSCESRKLIFLDNILQESIENVEDCGEAHPKSESGDVELFSTSMAQTWFGHEDENCTSSILPPTLKKYHPCKNAEIQALSLATAGMESTMNLTQKENSVSELESVHFSSHAKDKLVTVNDESLEISNTKEVGEREEMQFFAKICDEFCPQKSYLLADANCNGIRVPHATPVDSKGANQVSMTLSRSNGKSTNANSIGVDHRKKKTQHGTNFEDQYAYSKDLWDPYLESSIENKGVQPITRPPIMESESSPKYTITEPLSCAPSLSPSQRILISCEDFETVWDMLPNELVLIIFSYLPQEDLKRISIVCQRFHAISRDACLWLKAVAIDKEVTSEWLDSFIKVQELHIERCKVRRLSSRTFRQFFQKSRDSLKRLHVSQCIHKSLYGDNVLLLASTYCKNLESISMPWSNTTDNGISALETSNVVLSSIDISGNCFISDSSMIPLLKKTGETLHTLKMNGCFALTNDTFAAIADYCCHLKVLQIGLCPKVTSDCLILISQSLSNLRELDIHGLKCVNDACLDSISKNCQSLTKLVLANCQLITDSSISNLAIEIPSINELDLSGCPKITDTGCSSLVITLKGPAHLNLSSTSISHATVSVLTENFYHSLESLKLSFCNNITQECIERLLSFCFKLRCLHIHGCKRLKVKELQENRSSVEICC